ncbi:MAG: sensor histidine kinase [Chloroflexi bacterium]|nr:sensor histidine kinase [Chloroflexota bacterium]
MAISTERLSMREVGQSGLVWRWSLARLRAWPRQKTIADIFRLAAFSAAILQIVAFPNGPAPYNAFPDSFISGSKAFPYATGYNAAALTGLVIAAGIYSILKIAQPFKWHQVRTINVSLLVADVTASVLLVHFSGGIHSPFILYTLLPVLTAALTKDYMVTVIVSVITGGYVLAGNILNPASNYTLTLQAVNDFLVYSIALGLVAALPYAINLTEGRKLRSGASLTERRRISHELHDSVCQTLCGLGWQLQRLSERTPAANPLSGELKKMEEAVNAAEQEARGLLEMIRTLGENGKFLSNISHLLKHLKRQAGISYRLECDDTDIKLAGDVEHDLSMICVEALTNVKKHAGARNILFSVKRGNGRVQIKIADDGCGFDGSNKLTHKGDGLAIMRERAELIGGTLQVVSAIGQGTEILVDIVGGGIRSELR